MGKAGVNTKEARHEAFAALNRFSGVCNELLGTDVNPDTGTRNTFGSLGSRIMESPDSIIADVSMSDDAAGREVQVNIPRDLDLARKVGEATIFLIPREGDTHQSVPIREMPRLLDEATSVLRGLIPEVEPVVTYE